MHLDLVKCVLALTGSSAGQQSLFFSISSPQHLCGGWEMSCNNQETPVLSGGSSYPCARTYIDLSGGSKHCILLCKTQKVGAVCI